MPVPNFSGVSTFFFRRYTRFTSTALRQAGRGPVRSRRPIARDRIVERRHSSAWEGAAELHAAILRLRDPSSARSSTSARRKTHITGTSSMPCALHEPNVNRRSAEIESIPTVPSAKPSATITTH